MLRRYADKYRHHLLAGDRPATVFWTTYLLLVGAFIVWWLL